MSPLSQVVLFLLGVERDRVKARTDFYLEYEVAQCKRCDVRMCKYHTEKAQRLGLNIKG